jgi:DNA-binding NtrC family response regulator
MGGYSACTDFSKALRDAVPIRACTSHRQEKEMQQPTHVLILTHDDAIRNLLEQVFIIRDVQILIAETVQGAEAIINLWGLSMFGLVIIDTAALGEYEMDQKRVACRILEEWTTAHPALPFLFLGTVLQKHAIYPIRADIVRVLVKPFRLDELVDVVDDLYPEQHHPHASLPRRP